MRTDLYTKAVLTVIALALALIALKPMISPAVAVQAQAPSANLQFLGGSDVIVMDKQTGYLWVYRVSGGGGTEMLPLGRFLGPGKPLQR
jgi:hypothetical protein